MARPLARLPIPEPTPAPVDPRDGIESFKMRRQFARERLALPSTSKREKRDLIAEIEWFDSRIAVARIGRRGDA